MSDNRTAISKSCYSGSSSTHTHDSFNDDVKIQIKQIKSLCSEHHIKIGFTCSSFDLLHPGHVIMLEDCKKQCDVLVVGIQKDPTLDRPDAKNIPVQTYEERKIMVKSCRYVDHVIEYSTENDLYNILCELMPHVRVLGSDWKGKEYTGCDIEEIEIYWHDRSGHNYSTTNLRKRIYKAEKRNNS